MRVCGYSENERAVLAQNAFRCFDGCKIDSRELPCDPIELQIGRLDLRICVNECTELERKAHNLLAAIKRLVLTQ